MGKMNAIPSEACPRREREVSHNVTQKHSNRRRGEERRTKTPDMMRTARYGLSGKKIAPSSFMGKALSSPEASDAMVSGDGRGSRCTVDRCKAE